MYLLQGILGSGFALKVSQHQRQKHVKRRRRPAAMLIQVRMDNCPGPFLRGCLEIVRSARMKLKRARALLIWERLFMAS